ncbi:hypothetical protein SAMN02745117_02424 [Lampropedia hyalina DSM 16112]|jgi:hypothetical protein|uniref:HEPN domain-containing protein n=1 Tax=Lampropedia hyalina DSM 16112 TaxID=1122156 RepID=A0A1M5DM85_9BURK|nr:hypothetical protein [Lampropedia hyalina]SHF68093.1 hypothetical protein SAMN02745117_02424 [Lampropedia hyalina DSM 16112]
MSDVANPLPGWMVETSYKYAKLAEIALVMKNDSLELQSEVNAALAVEILLKSLLVEPVHNHQLGTLATRFKLNELKILDTEVASSVQGGRMDRHNLYHLYGCISEHLRKELGLLHHKTSLQEKARVFTKKRYDYEADSKGETFDDTLLHIAGDLIPRFVDYFLQQGSEDPWLLLYKKQPQYFKLPTGISI